VNVKTKFNLPVLFRIRGGATSVGLMKVFLLNLCHLERQEIANAPFVKDLLSGLGGLLSPSLALRVLEPQV